MLLTRHIVEKHYRLRFCILESHYNEHFLVLAVGVVAYSLHILDNVAKKPVLVLVWGLIPNVNILQFQAIRVYDVSKALVLPEFDGLQKIARKYIGTQCSVTSFFISTLPCMFIEMCYG